MKTKKVQHLIFLSAFIAIFLAVISIFMVNKIMAREINAVGSRNSSSASATGQENSSESRAREKKKVEKELKPEVEIEIKEVKKEKEKEKATKKVEEKEEKLINKTEEKKKEAENNVSQIKSEVEGAEKVEYKLVKKGSIEPVIYLGEGKKESKKNEKSDSEEELIRKTENKKDWSLEYDFSNVPKGEYDLYADVKNQYGTYSSNKTSIKIEEDRDQIVGRKVLMGQEGITIKVSNIKKNDTGDRLKEVRLQQEIIEKNSNLNEEDKQEKLAQLEDDKKKIISEFNFRNQIEEIYQKENKEGLSYEEKQEIEEIKKILKVDSDADGLPDHEELRIGTNPFSADTDQDGYLDGDEVANGYDPMKTSTKEGVDKIMFSEPKTNGKENILYQVKEVDLVKNEKSEVEGTIFNGRALPNSFITLYIYSSPVVVTVKTDEDGNWSYVLNKELEEGNHEVYAAVTDNTGKITSKSKPFAFVKTAQAVEQISSDAKSLNSNQALSPMEESREKLLIFVILISIFSLISAVASIALLVKHKKEKINS